ncbi:MAG: aldehyde dehydrogenase family protein, partial [Acidobacteriota bacterium]|nr:aldehyde dehydrogenase family protein [Acidobacteriota bacterium]
IAFTGSTEVGKLIVHAAEGNLKKVSLELGGKSPNIVFQDAEIESAIPGAANAIFFNQGQVCCAGSRLYVEDKQFDRVVDGVSQIASKLRVGPGMEPASELGPLVSEEQLNRVCRYLESGFSEGAKAVTGGSRQGDKGYFVKPTVLVNTNEKMKVVREEIFGPVVTVMPFKDVDDLIARANNTPFGLAAAVWTRDVKKAHRIAAELKAGTVWVNCYGILDAAMPFGGYKQSGWGREMGGEMLDLYTQTKSVCMPIS